VSTIREQGVIASALAALGELVRRITLGSIRQPLGVLASWGVFLAACLVGALGLEIETSISSLLDTSSESWSTYQRSLDRHGSDEFVAVVLEGDVPFAPASLQRIDALTDRLEALPGVARVDGLASVALIRAGREQDVLLSPALWRGVPEPGEPREQLRRAIARDPIARGAYISRDERSLALNVILDDDVLGDRDGVVAEIERIVGPDAAISGVPIFRTRINGDTQRESFTLLPFALALMVAILFWTLRSVVASALPLLVGGIGSLAIAGALGATGTPLSLSTLILPSVLLALGCAYAMHVVTAANGVTQRAELENQLRAVAVPVAVSGMTTALGFLSISTSTIATIRELGVFGAFGVIVVTAACLTLLPALLAATRVALPTTPAHNWLIGPMSRRVASLCSERRGWVALAWAVVALAAAGGIGSLGVSTNIVSWYPIESQIRGDYERIREALSGISPVSLYLESTGGRSAVEPDVVAALDRLSDELEARADVGKVLGIQHPLRAMREAYLGAGAGLPVTLQEARQYLLLLESEEPVWDVISRDQQSTRLLMRVDDNGSAAIMGIARWAEDWWRSYGPADFNAHATGIMFEFAKTNQAIVRTQLVGLALALAGVGGVLWLLMGTPARAFAALVPNLIPLAAAYGAMGYAGVPLDAGTACLGSLALGIAVDDTVHVAANWSRERAGGAELRKALEAAFASVMPALVLSSACIVAGFAVLGLSELGLVRNLGLVTASVVFICWAADVTLLPVLLEFVERRSGAEAR
jgi:predicted RND superfamily exporter protein